MPITFGTTRIKAPDTPDFAGNPTCEQVSNIYENNLY